MRENVSDLDRMVNAVEWWQSQTGLAVHVDLVSAELYLLFVRGQQANFPAWWVQAVEDASFRLGMREEDMIRVWQFAELPGPQPCLAKKQDEAWLLARPLHEPVTWWSWLFG